ncbi:MAG: anti-sigma factor [Oceanococcaceae bacterium]
MNLERPEIRDALAAEYALGTLDGLARKRFTRLLSNDADLQQRVARWETLLTPLAENLPAVTPTARTWEGLAQRLGFTERSEKRARGFWDWVPTLAFAVVVLAISGVLLNEPVRQNLLFVPDVEVAISDDEQGALWTIRADRTSNRLAIETLQAVAVAADKSLELWLLRGEGEAPVSLGLLPTTSGERIRLKVTHPLDQGSGFAVSVEPRGGSTTGLPTGPVIYVQPMASAQA